MVAGAVATHDFHLNSMTQSNLLERINEPSIKWPRNVEQFTFGW